MRSSETNNKASGMISASEAYTLNEFRRRMGLTQAAMRAMRRKGMKVNRVGKRGFVDGRDAIEWLKTQGEKK